MKKWSVRLLSALCVAALLVGLLPLGALAADAAHTLWIVGDSTVCDFGDTDKALYYPRYGYGTQIGNYLDGSYKVENLALSGRSSKSFVTDFDEKKPTECGKAYYERMLAEMKAGDALIVGFGHNDEKVEDAERYTSGTGDWQTEGSFAKSLYDNYVKPAQDKGAEVILCTPIVRRTTKDAFASSEVHVTAQGDYPAAVRKLGTDKNVAVVDLTALTKALYEELTPAGTGDLHSQSLSPKDGKARGMDNTHLNIYGAKVVARMLASALAEGNTELGKHVVLGSEPNKATDLVVNPSYVEPSYVAPAEDAERHYPDYTTGDITFKGTFFGEPGGNTLDFNNYVLETDGDGNAHMAALNDKSKIEGSRDGLAMYYVRVPMGMQVEMSAKVKLNSFSNHNQTAFGLMARDDMYIDTVDRALASDYVAAGTFGNGSSNCFYRRGGTLTKTSALSKALTAGDTYALSIKSNSDGYTCQFGDEPAQSGGFDFQLNTIDPDFYYVGMFVSRNADVTFSDISLKLTGEPETPSVKPNDPTPGVTVTTDAVAGGGLETLFAELPDVADADVTAVKWSGDATGELTGDDLTYLVREATLSGGKTGVRIDIPGVKAGTYTLQVTIKDVVYTAKDLTVQAHDRSGFAHQTVDENSVCTPYTEGVGAYKDDGTLKDNAIVLYVTDANKDTVTMSVGSTSVTGIGKILNSGQATNNGVSKVLLEASRADTPVVVRIVGTVTQPQGVSPRRESTDSAQENGDNGGMCYISYAKNITIEGIGPDATINGWGLSFRGDATDANNDNYGKNFEVRNLSFREVPEDCVEVTGNGNSNGTIKEPVSHAWVHNCSFYVPHIANPAAVDKGDGDGAVDFKFGQYMTLSYNYFEDYHKTSLVGGDDKNQQYHVTWHHNHWKNCDQRIPLARQADIHYYNNLAEGQKTSAMSLRANTYIFSEYNTFVNCKNPVEDKGTGGVCKSYQDVFENCTGLSDAQVVTDKTQTVTSANKYANFDTAAGSYVKKEAYKLDTADRGQANIAAWGGVMKAAADMTTVAMTVPGSEKPPVVDPDPETPADTTALTAAITAAEKTINVYTVSDDTQATDVDRGTKFVKQSDKDIYQAAIDAAKAVLADPDATQDKVDKAVTDLAAATTAFNKAIKTGTKGSNGGGNTSSSRPSGAANSSDKPSTDTPDIDVTKPASENFGDVVKDSWYEAGVTYVVNKGLFLGVSKGVFAPERNMTRAMLMTVLARLDNKETEGGETWYAKGMAWAVEAGISDGTLPEVNVSREQVVTMLFRYANPTVLDKSDALGDFNDAASVSDWAVQAMQWAVKVGVITGKDGQRLDPQGTATRAEVAAILQRFVENTGK